MSGYVQPEAWPNLFACEGCIEDDDLPDAEFLTTGDVVQWQDDMRADLEVNSIEDDYGVLPKDMWIEIQSTIRCDTCGVALERNLKEISVKTDTSS